MPSLEEMGRWFGSKLRGRAMVDIGVDEKGLFLQRGIEGRVQSFRM